jgi:hypothetical protein
MRFKDSSKDGSIFKDSKDKIMCAYFKGFEIFRVGYNLKVDLVPIRMLHAYSPNANSSTYLQSSRIVVSRSARKQPSLVEIANTVPSLLILFIACSMLFLPRHLLPLHFERFQDLE